VIKDSSELLRTVQAPRVAAAVVIAGLGTLWSVGELTALAARLVVPAWPVVAIGFLVFVGAGVLIVELVRLGVAAAVPKVGAAMRQRARDEGVRRAKRADAEAAAAILENRVRDLTTDEQSFLDLFAVESLTARRMQTELLPREIYAAVHSLLAAGIIERVVRRDDATYTERYRIAGAAVGPVQQFVLKQPLGHSEILLDLARVQGTRASGSGAPGGYR
jgi:hypothetical protein